MPKGNEEYQRLLALLKSNSNYKIMLDTISKAEGTWGKDAYHTHVGGKVNSEKGVKNRKVVKVNGIPSSADGKYQFLNDTWDGLSKKLNLTGFTAEEQDVAALALAEESGALKHIDDGNVDKAIFSLAPTWASLPKDASGKSVYKGQSAKPLSKVLGYMKSNESARADLNNKYKSLNEKNVKEYGSQDNDRVVSKYYKDLKNIQINKNLSEEEKNAAKHELKRKNYREGNMALINVSINEENKLYDAYVSKLQKYANRGSDDLIDADSGMMNTNAGMITEKEFDNLQSEGHRFNITLGKPKFEVAGGDESNKKATRYLKPEFFQQKLKEVSKLYTPMQIEPALLKYGKSKEEYDAEVGANAPVDYGSGLESDIENGTADTTTTTEQEAKTKSDKAVTDKLAAEALEKKKIAPTSFSELDNDFTQEMFSDPKFKYVPGKAEVPFDALLGLASGLAGMNAADIDIKYRDEQVGEGMLQYAADIAKIKNMGLPPEIEGDLKQKLASAYQTGITNIVRASNGNRNLVLGNQGQLDQARMTGIVEIAAMDVDRRDKALAAFGEVQKYISDFDAKRDIANNERKYAEDQKTQIAGAQLAQTGLSSFIDSIAHAKENGPGSINDMKRQHFAFKTTGLIKGATAGEPGSPEFVASKQLENELAVGKKRDFNDWVATKSREEKDVINNILLKHPEKNPLKNKDANLDDLITFTKEVTGDAEYESEYQKYLGISDLTTKAIAEDTSNIKADATGTPAVEPVKEKEYATEQDNVMPIVTQGVNATTGKGTSGQAELKGKVATHREDAPLVDANGVALINGVPQKVKGDIVGTTGLSEKTIQDGLNKGSLTPSSIDASNNSKSFIAETSNRMNTAMKSIEEINKAAEERDMIFNQQQEANQAKLDLVTGKR